MISKDQKNLTLKILYYHVLHNRGIGTLKQSDHKIWFKKKKKKRIRGSIPLLPSATFFFFFFFFSEQIFYQLGKSSLVTIFSCYQLFELINFDGCRLIATSDRLILFWKIYTTRSLWLDSLLWTIYIFFFFSCFYISTFSFVLTKYPLSRSHILTANNNII